jgi:hypothetical protein
VKKAAAEILSLIFILAVVYLLVRPGSLGPDVIATFGSALANIVTFAVSS